MTYTSSLRAERVLARAERAEVEHMVGPLSMVPEDV